MKILKNGNVYSSVVETDVKSNSNRVVHGDNNNQVGSTGTYVSYGPVDSEGFVVKRQPLTKYREDHKLLSYKEKKAARRVRYTDATDVVLHKIIDGKTTGKLHDYVVKSVSVNDGYNTSYNHYDYDESSATYHASSGAGIYGKIQEIPSNSSTLTVTGEIPVTPFGSTEHYFYNQKNFFGLGIKKGYPKT